jgi:DNA ligase 4
MIVYFDAILIDDESLLSVRHSERFKRLENLLSCRKGHAELIRRQVISFDQRLGASDLRKAFAKCITTRDEGLVLKPDDPYFDFSESRRDFAGCPIKLKKEYIGSFGDVGDFAVVGARYDPDRAKTYCIPNLKWTHFFIGCLNNKEAVQRWKAKPRFTVVNMVDLTETMLKTVINYGNTVEVPFDDNGALFLQIAPGIANGRYPTTVFTNPLVFDIRCFSFDKQGNTGHWSLRFPVVSKVHFDRSYLDTVSFSDLQAMAEEAKTAPTWEDSQELCQWIAALEGADPRGIPVDAVSQLTTSTMATPSPQSVSTAGHSQISAPPQSPSMTRALTVLGLLVESKSLSLTPSTSSAPKAARPDKPILEKKLDLSPQLGVTPDKQHWELARSPRFEKCRKRARGDSASNTSLSSPGKRQRLPSLSRQPLSDININASPPQPRLTSSNSYHVLSTKSGFTSANGGSPSSQSASFNLCTTPATRRSMTMPSAGSAPRQKLACQNTPPPSSDNDPKLRCERVGSQCLFAGQIFLLSPDIERMFLVTDNLLRTHGITDYITDPEKWATPLGNEKALNATAVGADTQPYEQKPRLKKTILVEGRDKAAATGFLERVKKVPIQLQNGQRDWTPVYDWRVLECIAKLEEGDKSGMNGFSNPWRKYWVGLV